MGVVVWVSAWELQCCGRPFAVGEQVSWTLTDEPDVDWLAAAVGAQQAGLVTHAEEHHSGRAEDPLVTTGTVRDIRAAFGRYTPVEGNEKVLYPDPTTTELCRITRVDGRETVPSGARLNGYLVDLRVSDPAPAPGAG